MADLSTGSPPSAEISPGRQGGKRKRGDGPEEREEAGDLQDLRPLKRVSPFLNTPKQRKEEKRKVLRMSYEKLRAIDDPEKCLLRSVLVHNTAKKMQRELMEEGGCWGSSRMLGTSLGCSPGIPPMGYPGDLYQDRFLCRPARHCEFEVLNNSYLYTNPHLFVDHFSHTSSDMEEICRDDLSRALEQSLDTSKSLATTTPTGDTNCRTVSQIPGDSSNDSIKEGSKQSCFSACSKTVNSPVSHSPPFTPAMPVAKRPSSPALWDYQAYAANLTGAPLFTGSITMGIPVSKDQLRSDPSKATPTTTSMETDSAGRTGDGDSAFMPSVTDTHTPGQVNIQLDTPTHLTPSHLTPTHLTPPHLTATPLSSDCSSSHVGEANGSRDNTGLKDNPLTLAHNTTVDNSQTSSLSRCLSCDADKSVDHNTCSSRRIVTSATTLATFSHELDTLMTDYFARSNPETSRPLSCAYLSGVHNDSERETCTSRQTDSMDSVLNSLVPVLGGM